MDDGTLFLTYRFGIQDIMAKDKAVDGRQSTRRSENGLTGSVRMREGEQISLIKVGNRSFRLKISKLTDK